MGSCAHIRSKPKSSKPISKTESSDSSIKDTLASNILALHRLDLECKTEIENCGVSKDLQTAVLLKQKQMEIKLYLKEIQDLLKKYDNDSDNNVPDKLRERFLNDQGSRLLGKFSYNRIVEEIRGILIKNKKAIRDTRKMSEKLNFQRQEIEESLKKELEAQDGTVVRKKYRRRKSSIV